MFTFGNNSSQPVGNKQIYLSKKNFLTFNFSKKEKSHKNQSTYLLQKMEKRKSDYWKCFSFFLKWQLPITSEYPFFLNHLFPECVHLHIHLLSA